jgi:hypothetical protein
MLLAWYVERPLFYNLYRHTAVTRSRFFFFSWALICFTSVTFAEDPASLLYHGDGFLFWTTMSSVANEAKRMDGVHASSTVPIVISAAKGT